MHYSLYLYTYNGESYTWKDGLSVERNKISGKYFCWLMRGILILNCPHVLPWRINPFCAEFIFGILEYISICTIFLSNEMAQVVEIFCCWKQGPVDHAKLIPCLLMAWRCKEPGHQQPWHWQVSHDIPVSAPEGLIRIKTDQLYDELASSYDEIRKKISKLHIDLVDVESS